MSDPYVPTLKLRFVERADENAVAAIYGGTGRRRVLQQWWEDWSAFPVVRPGTPTTVTETIHIRGEWRDVPLETE